LPKYQFLSLSLSLFMGPFQIKVRSRLPSLSVQRWLILSFLFLFNHFFLLVYFFFPYYIGKEILSISFLSIMLGKKSFLFLFAQLCVCVCSLFLSPKTIRPGTIGPRQNHRNHAWYCHCLLPERRVEKFAGKSTSALRKRKCKEGSYATLCGAVLRPLLCLLRQKVVELLVCTLQCTTVLCWSASGGLF
jgi:hypothetical protein